MTRVYGTEIIFTSLSTGQCNNNFISIPVRMLSTSIARQLQHGTCRGSFVFLHMCCCSSICCVIQSVNYSKVSFFFLFFFPSPSPLSFYTCTILNLASTHSVVHSTTRFDIFTAHRGEAVQAKRGGKNGDRVQQHRQTIFCNVKKCFFFGKGGEKTKKDFI